MIEYEIISEIPMPEGANYNAWFAPVVTRVKVRPEIARQLKLPTDGRLSFKDYHRIRLAGLLS